MHAIFSHFLTGCVIWPPPMIEKALMAFSMEGYIWVNFQFFSKSILYKGVYLDIWGVTNIPPGIFELDPCVHLGGIIDHFTSNNTKAPFPPAHSCMLILSDTSICPNATPTTIRKRERGGRQQGHGEKAAGRMTTRRKPNVASDCKNLFVQPKLKCCSCHNHCQTQEEEEVWGGSGG